MSLLPPDEALQREWLPLVNSSALEPGALLPFTLAGLPVVAWRAWDGTPHVWHDQCPHRGARLSLGRVEREQLVCGYHGWTFDGGGRCTHLPAHPGVAPPVAARTRPLAVCEKYGVLWACFGEPARELVVFPEYEQPGVRCINLAPKEVATSAPRLMENFLDMGHFPFVHAHILGQEPHTEVRDYRVEVSASGLVARDCFFWQPSGMPSQPGGGDIEYIYEVRRPMIAMLTKLPVGGREAGSDVLHIMLALSPVDECRTRAWLVSVFENDPLSSDQALYDFNAEIFEQDVPVVESQMPKWLPLEPNAEVHQRSDRMSVTYRRWLAEAGWHYGTSRGAAARRVLAEA
jgi:phenylpropionate dioxygenase-like ring-hydroxylating dioxygenase large terminal subunit